ncbi:DUF3048 domain-containing protein [Nakamurella sp. YIM 132087]|uniref:DUF3048 domain-containing protein n=1 Tax=Nakamurella alba TaxID=2665158 RepID=A0A7K1FQF6_9ACTN|nr:DUF3048 domain-containing protein [Nakamurella alba]MTD16377.1 DUF3048 domain-containing protein [Nakamurella alba]
MTNPDPLTGQQLSGNPVVAVKIDNTYFDVAQFGVSKADVVFVEQVEGGLTRLIAVFHTNLDQEVGPVRSVRTTDAELLPAFGTPALVFSGGAQGPLDALASTSVVNTSDLQTGYFRSDVASGSYNLHANLAEVVASTSGLTPARSIGFTFAATDARVAKGSAATEIAVTMQAGLTTFSWNGSAYARMRNGEAMADYQGDPQLADNVLVQSVVDEPDGTYDTVGSPSYISHTVGSGAVTLYRDGKALEGTWSRDSVDGTFSYLDAAGKPLPFKPGRTWVILAPQSAYTEVS